MAHLEGKKIYKIKIKVLTKLFPLNNNKIKKAPAIMCFSNHDFNKIKTHFRNKLSIHTANIKIKINE